MDRQSGFTIIEVLLFLSISGLLLMFAIVSFTATIQNTRFTEATNSIEGFISQQYNDVRSGVSYRPDTNSPACTATQQAPGAADNCIVVGRLLDIKAPGTEFGTAATVIKTYTIVANRCPNVAQATENNCSGSGSGTCVAGDATLAGRIGYYCPQVLPTAYSEDYTLPWGTHLPREVTVSSIPQPNPRAKRSNDVEERINRIAIIHSPTSERIYTYSYSDTSSLATTQPISRSFLTAATADSEILLCLKSPDLLSTFHYVAIGAGQGSDLITSGAIPNPQPGARQCS